jgi:mono/diheme cytochrome c family protein
MACVLAGACALPGRPVRVLPEVQGRIAADALDADARLMLAVIHRESHSLHARQELALADDGRFRFEPVFLEVAGHEFSKRYRVYLHLHSGGSDRVIWRAEISRLAVEASIPLECDLARPVALGEVCRVADPLRQPWLLAEGRDHFVRLCARCHGADGTGPGKSTTSSPLPTAGATPDLTRIAERHGGHFEPDRVAAWIEGRSLSATHSRGGMPVWGERLSNEFAGYAEGDELIGATLDPIVAYLESLQRERGQRSD